jgi:NADH-quinone oxidoreductase subunit H
MDLHHLLITIITIAAVFGVIMGICAYLILLERKVAAYVQDRLGPNRVGPRGLLQPIADGLKFLFKEEVIPDRADKVLFLAAPAIAMSTALLAFAVVPFGPTTVPPEPAAGAAAAETYKSTYQFVIAPNVDIGIVFIFAITSLTVYAIILGGWSSNNKYSFIGGLRSSAQLVSYEIPMAMSVLGIILMTGSLNLERVINHQVQGGILGWNIWVQPLAFLLFLTSAFAECNRLPFDLPEAEQELVGGYHTEYSALKFAMFFLGEYTHMVTTSFLMVILFFGGWHFPGIPEAGWLAIALKLLVFFLKVTVFILFYMLVRWTIPRFRFDQLMGLAWKVLVPLALVNLVAVMVVEHMIGAHDWNANWRWLLLPVSLLLIAGTGFLAIKEPPGRARPQLSRTDFQVVEHQRA